MKSSRILFIAVIAFLLTACASVSPVGEGAPLAYDAAVTSGALDNGLSWHVLRNPEPANRIYLRLAVRAGSAMEDDDQKGVAHLIEHMAFNGTEHFAKNELVDYFETIGMVFGPEVNAYTSFDETVYMLEIPADDPAILERSLLVLRDWACSVAFAPEELEKERGVVVEEWRLGRGANGRVQDRQIPLLFRDSRYADRRPIGDPEIVKTIPRERVLDFYRSWYRPELMSILAVGDFERGAVEDTIKKILGTVPPSAERKGRAAYPVPRQKEPSILISRDPEITYTTLQILEQFPAERLVTTGDYRKRLADSIAVSVFNRRLSEKTLAADPIILGAETGSAGIARPTKFNYLVMVPATGRFMPAFQLLLEELERIETHGITDAELSREKAELLDQIRQAWLDRDKAHSAGRAAGLLSSVLTDDAFLSIDERYRLYNELVPGITSADIARIVRGWFNDRGKLLFVTASDAADDIPDEAALLDVWQNWRPESPVQPYLEDDLSRPLYPAEGYAESAPGAVMPAGNLSAAGVRQWNLPNGARVVWFPTDFKANEILFSAFSLGGTSLSSEVDYPSAAVAADYIENSGLNGFNPISLKKKLSGKTASVSSWIEESREGLSGYSSVSDLETLFQLINLSFTGADATDDGWDSLVAQYRTIADTRSSNPEERFSDLKVSLLWGNSIRRANLSAAFVDAMRKDRAEAVYRERFASAGDFTFVFTGSLDEQRLRDLTERYLSVLPSNGVREEARPVRPPFPAGVVKGKLELGIEPKSEVFLAFGGPTAIKDKDYELFDMLVMLIDLRLREVIREDMGGSYGVQVNGNLSNYPDPFYTLAIEFGCEPGREERLAAAVMEQLQWLSGEPTPESYLVKLRETFRRGKESGLKNNGYWHSMIVAELMRARPLDSITDTEGVLSHVNGETMMNLARRFINPENRVEAYLLPARSPEGAAMTAPAINE